MSYNLVYSREEFSSLFPDVDDSIIFIPETIYNVKTYNFVCIKPIPLEDDWFTWIEENCDGKVMCFSSNEKEEWWGFTNRDDIFLFLLRWA